MSAPRSELGNWANAIGNFIASGGVRTSDPKSSTSHKGSDDDSSPEDSSSPSADDDYRGSANDD